MSTVIVILILLMFIFLGFKRTFILLGAGLVLVIALSVFGIAMSLLPFILFIVFIYMAVNRNRVNKSGYTFRFKVGDSEEFFKRFYEYQQQQNGYRGQTIYTENPEKFYKVLGVESNATEEEIKKSYKTLAKKYHPDIHNGKEEAEKIEMERKFKELNEAYDKIKKARGMN